MTSAAISMLTTASNGNPLLTAVTRLENCIGEVRTWMTKNKLKMNDDKTQFLVLIPPSQRHHNYEDSSQN
jgi:hypothetical protein